MDMNPLLSSDQQLFLDAGVRFMEAECPMTRVRELGEVAAPPDDGYLRNAAALGWFAFFVPERYGGGSVSGQPVLDACVVAEARGRRLQPGPFVAPNIVAFALAHGGTEAHADLLADLATGDRLVTWGAADQYGSYDGGAGVQATAKGDVFVLSGAKGLVEDALCADLVLITAAFEGDVGQFLVPLDAAGVEVRPCDGLDITRRLSEVHLQDVAVPASSAVGAPGASSLAAARQLDLAAVLTVADSIGAIDHLFEMSRQYAIDRIAFGRPIGSFQAIKHLLADLSTLAEASKAGALAAARALEIDRHDSSETASVVKAFADEAGVDIAQGCFQVHGGIGFTWEHDLHLYLRRITGNSIMYGDSDWHRERVCQIHGL